MRSLGREDPLEEEMASRSSILAWKFQGQRSLAPAVQANTELNTTERAHVLTSPSGEARWSRSRLVLLAVRWLVMPWPGALGQDQRPRSGQ